MRLLIADDDLVVRRLVEYTLTKRGHEVVVTADGTAAWEVLTASDAPFLAILDWIMPGMDGIDVCRKLHERSVSVPTYVILLTNRSDKEDIVAGFEAGADDYLTKPFNPEELCARVQVGARLIDLQQKLAGRVKELSEALAQLTQVQGLLPICAWCKRIRDDSNYWQQIETYISQHTAATFSHGICPECAEKMRTTPPAKGA